MAVQDQVNQEAYYGIIPMQKNDRIYGFWDTILVTGGFAIATWCYVQGGYIGTVLNFTQAMTNTLFSMVLAGLFIYFAVLICTRFGIDLWVYQKAVYGYKVYAIIFFLSIGSTWGYEAINCKLFSNSMILVADSLGITLGGAWAPILGIFCVVCGWIIALKGPVMVRRATKIMVPCLFLVGVFIMILVFTNVSISDLTQMQPIDAGYYEGRSGYMLILEMNIAFIFGWAPVLGVIPRLVKTERKSYWGHLIGYSVIMAWFICIGAVTGLMMGSVYGVYSTDPTEWLIALAGPKLGLLSLIFIGFANVTTQAIATYSLTVSTKVINPTWNYKIIATLWSVFCAGLVLWNGIWDYYTLFLALVGAICVPVVTLLLVDFYFVRRGKFSMRSLYKVDGKSSYNYTNGVNLVALCSFCLAILSYFLVYDPVNYVPRSEIFMFFTASGTNALVAGGSYYLLSRIPAVNQYLLKDREEKAPVKTKADTKTETTA